MFRDTYIVAILSNSYLISQPSNYWPRLSANSPSHYTSRLGTLVFIFTLLCFSGWRLSNSGLVSDTNIGNLSGSGHIIDSHGEYIQGVSPPIHDNSHKHDA